MEYLLTVEDTFQLGDRGLTIVPLLPLDRFPDGAPGDVVVEVKRPDHTKIRVDAQIGATHFSAGRRSFWALSICLYASKKEVPTGSDVWLLSE